MYDVPIDRVTADMRRIAKILNFGVIYGLSPYGISQQTEFSPDEGQKFIETYFAKYPGIRHYIETVKEQVRADGYVATPLGRRRYIADINGSSYNVRQAAERAAVNMPIQGGAADIMKLAMIQVHHRIEEADLRTRMLLQVHDELMFEVPVEEVEALKEIIYDEMPRAMGLTVPLKVDVKTGYTWGDME
jgi:DNA polymerase-1